MIGLVIVAGVTVNEMLLETFWEPVPPMQLRAKVLVPKRPSTV